MALSVKAVCPVVNLDSDFILQNICSEYYMYLIVCKAGAPAFLDPVQ